MGPHSTSARMVSLAILAAFCFLQAGCAKSKITKANFDQISNDMSLQEVERLLGAGTPTGGDGALVAAQVGVDVGSVGARPSSTMTYKWESGNEWITVSFKQDKIVSKKASPGL
jgi:hypothetical protein